MPNVPKWIYYTTQKMVNELKKFSKKKSFFNTDNIQIIIQMHPNLPDMDKLVFDKMWDIFSLDPSIVGEYGWLKKEMIEIRYKRPPNIRELLYIGYTPKQSERFLALSQHYQNYKDLYFQQANLNNQFQPIINPQPQSQLQSQSNILSTKGMFIDESESDQDVDIIINNSNNLNNNNISILHTDEDLDLDVESNHDIVNNSNNTFNIIIGEYVIIIKKIMSNTNINLLQKKYAIINMYWLITSTHNTNDNQITYINDSSYENSIIVSQFLDKYSPDIRSNFIISRTNIQLNRITNNHNQNKHIHSVNINKSTLPKGCHGCPKGCGVCTVKNRNGTILLLQGEYYISSKLNQKFQINHHFNCQSNWIIYIVCCINCGIESVGSSKQSVRTRIGQHKNNVLNNSKGNEYPMVHHFNRINSICYCNQNKLKNFRFMILDGIDDPNLSDQAADQRLNKLEIKYQGELITHFNSGNDKKDFHNRGLNRRNYHNKYTKKDMKIKLIRTRGIRNNKLWNKNWILSKQLSKKFIFNKHLLHTIGYNKLQAINYTKQYLKSQKTRELNKIKKNHNSNNNNNKK